MDALTFIEGHDDSVGEKAKIGILVASDRASSNEYLDEGVSHSPISHRSYEIPSGSPLSMHT